MAKQNAVLKGLNTSETQPFEEKNRVNAPTPSAEFPLLTPEILFSVSNFYASENNIHFSFSQESTQNFSHVKTDFQFLEPLNI
tara:strand:+ start:110 stop:358 length:249 start_codon:yes stop_codon:yes gene_type:complete